MSKQEIVINIRIKKLDIAQSYFIGVAEFEGNEYKINIQGHWKDKIIKLPFGLHSQEKLLTRLSGNNVVIEEFLIHKGKSDWIEIDSDQILHYVADHQDGFDSLEIIL